MSDGLNLAPLESQGFWGALIETGEWSELMPKLGWIRSELFNAHSFIRIDTLPEGDVPSRTLLYPLHGIKFISVSTEEKVRQAVVRRSGSASA